MTEGKEQRPQLRLKNGAMADVRTALNDLEDLRSMQRVQPARFNALLAVVENRPNDAGPEHIRELREEGIIGPDGAVRRDLSDLTQSALQWQGDGPVLVNPFKLETEADRAIVEQVMKQLTSDLINLVFGPRHGGGSGRSGR